MEETEKTPPAFLSWEITGTEKRARARKLLLTISLPLILISVVGVSLYRPFSFIRASVMGGLDNFLYEAAWMVGGVSGSILAFLLISQLLPYASRKYYLDGNGVTVWRNGREKSFAWSELENFFVHRSMYFPESTKDWPGERARKEVYLASEKIEGVVFYLSKKSSNRFWRTFCKTFVVLYSEPGSSQQVSDFLSRHLPRQEMKPWADLGLIFYYFR